MNTIAAQVQQEDQMQFHPVASTFREMWPHEFEPFCEDIRANGLREPILLAIDPADQTWKIADGRNRYRACIRTGVKPEYREWNGIGDLTWIIVSLNLHRRHLDETERAVIAAKLVNTNGGGRPARNSANLQSISTARAADMLNVSTRSVASAAKVLKDGDPELVALLETGGVSVSSASQIADLSKEEQQRIIRKFKKSGRRSAKKINFGLRTQSLRQTQKGLGTCLYCNPEIEWTDMRVSAFAQRLEQRAKEAVKAGRSERNFSTMFESIAFDIEEDHRAAFARQHYDKILAVIDAGADLDDLSRQCAEKTDIQRITKIAWPEFNDAIAVMLDLSMIEAVKQGGKTDGARGARKTLFRRCERSEGDLSFEFVDDDFSEEDVYLDNRWD